LNSVEELRAILALQNEIDQKLDELIPRIKKLMDEHKGRIVVRIEGELYELARIDAQSQAMVSAKKHRGFFCQYRLVKLPEPIE
jgi:hypothetical protein